MESSENQYILQWREQVLKAAEALRQHDYEGYEQAMQEMDNAYEEYKKDEALSYNDETTFGAANEIFESALPTLFVKNQSVVREFIETMRGDKNLQAQFLFYETLSQYKPEYDRGKYLEEAVKLALEKIDYKTLQESNNKLYNIIKTHNIKPTEFLSEENLEFYRLCETIFAHPKSLTNLAKLNETYNRISKHMEEKAKLVEKEEKAEVMSLKDFTQNCNLNLTEAEKDFLHTLLSPKSEEDRKALFETHKKECLEQIESLINESNDSSTTNRLNTLMNNVKSKSYNKETVLEDIVKILEISDILND